MMPLGIIVPTPLESDILVRSVSRREDITIQGKHFYTGVLKGSQVAIGICGIGKANAAHGATLMLERFGPADVYILGVAGAYPSSGLKIGDIAVADLEIYGDEGLMLETEFRTMEEIGLPLAAVRDDRYYNKFSMHIPECLKGHPFRGPFVTVSSCTGTLRKGIEIRARFGALCENMEGASIAHVCLLNGVSAIEIRAISNIIEDRSGQPLDKSSVVYAAEKAQAFFLESCMDQD